jgi:hypothetical protein
MRCDSFVCSSIVLAVMLAHELAASTTSQTAARRASESAGVCLREGAKRAGSPPVQIDAKLKMPRKVRDVRPKYPDLPPGTVATMGPWTGEFLIGRDGKVAHVWTTREVKLTPPFPKFNQAIVDAIRQWQYDPLVIDSKPTPACATITVHIDFS